MGSASDIPRNELAPPSVRDHRGDWQVWLDLSVTRRKIHHTVVDPSGHPIYNSRFLSECLAYLAQNDVREYVLVPNRTRSLAVPLDTIRIERHD